MEFKVQAQFDKARLGELTTPHGKVQTPVFMPVGTQASVKSLSPEDLETVGSEIILGNTYHLYLRPGDELIRDMGKLHGFTGWNKPILTDSGGFQVSSLGHFRSENESNSGNLKKTKIDEEGVTFWSHHDGSEHRFTPEKSIQIQENLGPDILMAFDEATPSKGRDYSKQAMERTHRWLERSITEWKRLEAQKTNDLPQALFGIIQGGDFEDLRRESAEFVAKQDLPGIAVGGGNIGADWKVTSEQVSWIHDLLPKDKPVYFMGVGVNPEDLMAAIMDGADMFDCVAPTRLARTGILYNGVISLNGQVLSKEESPSNIEYQQTIYPEPEISYQSEFRRGRVIISNQRYTKDPNPIQVGCDCYTCRSGFSRSYLRHLFKAKELLYYRLASIHNIRFMIRTVEVMRGVVGLRSS